MQDFFRCDARYEARADVVATTSCKKLRSWGEGEQAGSLNHVIDWRAVLAGKYNTLIFVIKIFLNFIF
jgi:hypothetical protein